MNKSLDFYRNPTIIATHASDISGPAHYLKEFLIGEKKTVIFMSFPLSKGDKTLPQYSVFIEGNKVESKLSNFMLPLFPLNYFKDILLTILWSRKLINKYHLRKTYFFSGNNLLTLSGLVLRAFKVVPKVIFYAIDYAEERFHQKVLNFIYRLIDGISARSADFVLSNTNRTIAVRKKQGVVKEKNILTPNGAWTNKTDITPLKRDEDGLKITYYGALTIGKGIQFILKALHKLKNQKVSLHIFGYGPYESELRLLKDKCQLENVFFHGSKPNREIIDHLHEYDFSINLITDKEGYLYYCDPLKIKESLANGIPVISSAVPEISERIQMEKLGVVIKDPENSKELVLALKNLLLHKDLIRNYRQNIERVKGEFTWEFIYSKMLEKINT